MRGIGTRPTVSKPQAPCGTGSFSIIVDPYPPSLRGINSFAAGASARYSSSNTYLEKERYFIEYAVKDADASSMSPGTQRDELLAPIDVIDTTLERKSVRGPDIEC